ncbi:unnamed protein product [Leptidea sinapis]|uniref:Syndecan/Neurexin domain-containing protein n=1 Tax=Leptidea sinapis TaxID=189913 RepID=A0A5E4QZK1_9NEOP|nr:unnamed protein product [Leptidea sinapis]
MILRCALLCLISQIANTNVVKTYLSDAYLDVYKNTVHTGTIQKRDLQNLPPTHLETQLPSKNEAKAPLNSDQSILDVALSEGGIVKPEIPVFPQPADSSSANEQSNKQNQNTTTVEITKVPPTKGNETKITPMPKVNESEKSVANNDTVAETDAVDLNSPGVVKRALIVFGGLTLLAVAYFIFYRNKHKKFDAGNTHNTNDSNQFRYGVLNSEDRRENLELSRIPLTMESDDDDDEDLEIFDLGQKRKSISYSNLPGHDEEIVLRSSKDESKNNLLLDIEDGPSDTLINWSSSESKSVL